MSFLPPFASRHPAPTVTGCPLRAGHTGAGGAGLTSSSPTLGEPGRGEEREQPPWRLLTEQWATPHENQVGEEEKLAPEALRGGAELRGTLEYRSRTRGEVLRQKALTLKSRAHRGN